MAARLKEQYVKEVAPALRKEFGIDNAMAVPRLEKIVLNMGLGEAVANPKMLDGAAEELSAIAGQRAVVTKAKKSIATFKLRTGMPIGARVTLRGDRMWEFLDRLINIALPRVRDFRGRLGQGVRRPRQLHARRARPLHLSGDRLREDGQVQGIERDDRDDGRTGRPGQGAARRARHAVRQVKQSPGETKRWPHEQCESRRRGSRSS